VEQVADYLYTDTATTAGRLLDSCRQLAREARESSCPALWLRSFGITQAGLVDDALANRVTHDVCSAVVRRWRGESDTGGQQAGRREIPLSLARRAVPSGPSRLEQQSRTHTERLIDEHELVLASTSEKLTAYVKARLGTDSETFFCGVANEIARSAASAKNSGSGGLQPDPLLQALQAVTEVVGLPADEDSHSADSLAGAYAAAVSPTVDALLIEWVDELANHQAQRVTQSLLANLDQPSMRVAGMRLTSGYLDEHFRQIEQQSRAAMNRAKTEAVQMARAMAAERAVDARKHPAALRFARDGSFAAEQLGSLVRYGECLLQTSLHRAFCRWTQAHRSKLSVTHRHGRDALQELERLESVFQWISQRAGESGADNQSETSALIQSATQDLEELAGELSAKVDVQFQRDFIEPRGGLAHVLLLDGSVRSQLPGALRAAARKAVREAIRQVNLRSLFRADGADPASPNIHQTVKNGGEQVSNDRLAPTAASHLRELANQAEPGRIARGGTRRLMIIVPEGCPTDWLGPETFGGIAPSLVVDSDAELTFCREYDGLPLPWIAEQLVDGRPDLAEIACRVLTRFDIRWSRIPPRSL
jgi:hypothetical protein